MRRLPAVLLAVAFVGPAVGQPPQNVLPQPRLTSVFPMGAKAGTAVEVTVNGYDLDDPTALQFSHPGISAELIVSPEPKPDPKDKDKPKPPPKPKGPATSHKYKVTVPADAPLGNVDVRLVSKLGVSNPRAFVVGELSEVNETDKPNDDVPAAQPVGLNATVNGAIASAADVDYYRFTGTAGQRVLASCVTSGIDSRCRPLVEMFDATGKRLTANRNHRDDDALADVTLPTDGDFVVRVCEFAYQGGSPDHFYRLTVGTGPWIDAVFPPVVAFGKPTQVTLYGRNLPGGKPVPEATVDGRLVEAITVTVTPPADAPRDGLTVRSRVAPPQSLQDGFEFRLPGSNAVPLFVTDAAVYLEKQGDNDTIEKAEPVTVPGEAAGRIDRRYDRDWYSFDAKKGDTYFLELFADRLGSDMDVYFAVKAVANKGDVVPEQDDDPDSLHPFQFFTRTGDPAAAKFVAPADGKYAVLVASRESNVNFGPQCGYRLRIGKPTPDFRAVVMPKSRDTAGAAVGYAAGSFALDVLIDRRDGFAGPVTATVEGLPSGVTAAPAVVGTGTRWGTIVLAVADNAAAFTGPVSVTCSATIGDKPVSHPARPADITWSVQPNSNTPTVARLDRQLVLAVVPRKAEFRIAVDLPQAKRKTKDAAGKDAEVKLDTPLFVKPGDKLLLPVKVTWQGEGARPNPLNVKVQPAHPNRQAAGVVGPQGNDNNPDMAIPKDKPDGTLTVDVLPSAAPGNYAVVLRGDTQIQFARDPAQKDKKANAVVQAFADPLPITVLPLSLGKFTVQPPPNNQLKAGTSAELLLKVDRQHDYAGPFAVKVTIPPETKGVTAKELTLPAGTNELKVPIEVAKDAKDGGSYQFTVTATATVHDKFPIVHEVKAAGLRVVPEPVKKDEKKEEQKKPDEKNK
jgi:hypothetical protein